jgi:hypothetical protein
VKKFILSAPLELGVVDGEEALGAQPDPADVVDQDVDAAMPLDRRAHQLLGPVGGPEIGLHRGHPVDALQAVDRPRPGHDARPLVGQRPRHGQADALAGAGDDGHLVGQLEVHRYPAMSAVVAAQLARRSRFCADDEPGSAV